MLAPRRRPASGGYARGEEQRARIITAALKVFGDEGYEGASTRQIAKLAGIQPPALQYYFDSKEGLHRACAEFIIDEGWPMLAGPLAAAEAALAHGSPGVALDALCDLIDALVDASLFKREVPERARFSARAQAEQTPGGEVLRKRMSDPLNEICARLVGCVIGRPVDEHIQLQAILLMSQLLILHIHRDRTLERLGWPDFDGPRRAAVKAQLRAHTRAVLQVLS